jgi:hypothetical protein
MRREVRRSIEKQVAAGFDARADIVTSVVARFSDRFPAASLRPDVEDLVTRTVARRLKAQSYWPEITDCDLLDRAFAELEQNGILCRQNYGHCLTCGHAALRDEAETARREGRNVRGYTFFHAQDMDAVLDGNLDLAFGLPRATAEEFETIILALLPRLGDNDGDSAAAPGPANPGQPVRLRQRSSGDLCTWNLSAGLLTIGGETLQAIRTALPTLPPHKRLALRDAALALGSALSTVACEVVATLRRHGIDATWVGQLHVRIEGRLHWQKRRQEEAT